MDSISTLHSNEYPQEKDIIQKFLDIKNITFTDISNISSSDHDLGRTIVLISDFALALISSINPMI